MGFYAAENLSESWRHSCLKALGLEDWVVLDQQEEQERKPTANKFQVINLLPQEDEYDEGAETSEGVGEDDTTGDQWMQTALQIQSNILEMAGWIAQKRSDYISLEMPDEEASLIQSTVTSFTATTASEIETLHQCIQQQQHDKKTGTNQHQHCAGIVQILMSQLKEGIAEPFGKLQKTRTRAAVQLWQTPLQCRLWTPRHHRLTEQKRRIPPSNCWVWTTTTRGRSRLTSAFSPVDPVTACTATFGPRTNTQKALRAAKKTSATRVCRGSGE